MRRGTLLVALVAALISVPGTADARSRSVPRGWAGVDIDGSLFDPRVDLDSEFDEMAADGVEAVRVAVYWSQAQPYATWDDVPEDEKARFVDAGGVPTDFSAPDAVVARAAARDVEVLPAVLWAPSWARTDRGEIASPPEARPYAAFVAQLARRYGTTGSFWKENAELRPRPLTDWQVWNEPTVEGFWTEQPSTEGYVALLKAVRPRLEAADPDARVVLAGLVYESWKPLEAIYEAGGRGLFDVVAVHPFTDKLDDLVRILDRVRKVMARHGDTRMPLMITELSYPSSLGKAERFGYETTEAGQAKRLTRAFERLADERRRLRIERVHWYTWMTPDRGSYPFDYSGLRRLEDDGVVAKPALTAFRKTTLALEGRR
jgi:polysaccharide biosynthesis protein PslG